MNKLLPRRVRFKEKISKYRLISRDNVNINQGLFHSLTTNYQLLTANFGFTLIEVLVVIAILAGLGSIMILNYPGAQKRGRDTQRKSDIKQYQTAMEVYANKSNGLYFTTGSSNLTGHCGAAELNLSNCPDDPQAPTYNYKIISAPAEYVIWARLELPPLPVSYFIVCSTGVSGESTIPPSSWTCPL